MQSPPNQIFCQFSINVTNNSELKYIVKDGVRKKKCNKLAFQKCTSNYSPKNN